MPHSGPTTNIQHSDPPTDQIFVKFSIYHLELGIYISKKVKQLVFLKKNVIKIPSVYLSYYISKISEELVK